MKQVHHYGYERFTWDGLKLYHEGEFMVELVPSKYEKQYHLLFKWRDTPTPEFFNITNAKENSMRFTLLRLNYDMWEPTYAASQSDLNH